MLAIVLALAGVGFTFFHKFYPAPPAAHYPATRGVATRQRQDLDYFRNYFRLNRAYSPTALAEAEALYRETIARSGGLSPAAFDLAILRMVALSDNGHSQVYKPSLMRRHARLPCRFYRFDDGYYVVRAKPTCMAVLGAKLLAVEGVPVDTVVDRMYAYSLGPRNHHDQYVSPFFLEAPALLRAAGLATRDDRLAMRVKFRDGSEHDVTIVADPAQDEPEVYSDAFLSPQPIAGESADWTPLLLRAAELPIFLRDYENPFQSAYWPDRRVYYAQFRSNADDHGHPIRPFVARIEREIVAREPHYIVLDLRLDQGGNFTTTAGLMKRLAGLSGSIRHVYVLTSAWTFSAGNISVALVKEHGAGKVTVVGQPAGDRIRIWAEGRSLTLPNSRLAIHYATGYEDYSKPCWGHPGCFWTTLFYPTHVTSFDPDVRVSYTFDDYAGRRDPLLDKALELARTP